VLVPQAGGTAFWREAGEGRQARRRPQPVAASAFAMPRRGAGLVEGGLHAHSRVLSAGVTVWDGSPQTTSLYPILPGDICFLDRCVWHQVPCPRLPCPAPAYLALRLLCLGLVLGQILARGAREAGALRRIMLDRCVGNQSCAGESCAGEGRGGAHLPAAAQPLASKSCSCCFPLPCCPR